MTNKEFFSKNWHKEMKRTLVAIRALPEEIEKLGYKPDALSRTAHEIIGHILPHAEDLAKAIDTKEIHEQQLVFKSRDEAYDYFESNSKLLVEKLAVVSDYEWENSMVSLGPGDVKLYEGKMMDMFWVLLFDSVHHRGQLSTYYRKMGVPNPSIYGPTAEQTAEVIERAKKGG
jgi:uncharacterized damage-inducible protein DinB